MECLIPSDYTFSNKHDHILLPILIKLEVLFDQDMEFFIVYFPPNSSYGFLFAFCWAAFPGKVEIVVCLYYPSSEVDRSV